MTYARTYSTKNIIARCTQLQETTDHIRSPRLALAVQFRRCSSYLPLSPAKESITNLPRYVMKAKLRNYVRTWLIPLDRLLIGC